MTVKVSDVMRHVRNHFISGSHCETWQQQAGVLTPGVFLPGTWIAVTGDDAPRGLYQLDEQGGIPGLDDCSWRGVIHRLNPPADFLHLCGDISCWAAANPDPAISGEKLGDYSVSRKAISWEEAFAPALAPYRRMFPEVQV